MTKRQEARWEDLKATMVVLQSTIKEIISEYLAVVDFNHNGDSYSKTVRNGMDFYRSSLQNLEHGTFEIVRKDISGKTEGFWNDDKTICSVELFGKKYEFFIHFNEFNRLIEKYSVVVRDKTEADCKEFFEICRIIWFMLLSEMNKIEAIDPSKKAKFDELYERMIQEYLE